MRKLKLLLTATALLLLGGISAWAQTDVTSTYLTNAGFETSPTFDGTSLGSNASSKSNATPTDGSELLSGAKNVYQISGWTLMTTETSDFARTFTMPYNTTLYVNSNGSTAGQAVTAPANGSSVTEGNDNVLFVEANWCNQALLGVKQTVNLPAGKYTLTFDTYVTTNLNYGTSRCGVSYGSTTNYKWPTALNTWTNNEITFTLADATDVTISMGYLKNSNQGGGNSPFLFVDNVKLTYTAIVVKDVLETALTAATNANTTLKNSDLTTAIATAQSVYENEDATQEQVNNAAATLNTAVELAMSAVGDVTLVFLDNPGFENCTAETSDVAAKTIKDYSSVGWTKVNSGDFTTIAVTAYGGGKKVGGSTTPSTKKDGTTVSGNTLGIIAGWGDNVTIQSREITWPAGVYTFTVDHYLTSSTSNYGNNSSKFGLVTSSNSYLVSSTTFSALTWTTETVTFTLTESTTGKIQIGLTGLNASGSGSPAVFYDDITITYQSFLAGAKSAWNEAKAAAEAASDNDDYSNITGSELTDLNEEINKAEPTTVDGYNEAATALTNATNTFTAAKDAYDAYANFLTVYLPEDELAYATTAKYTAIGDAYYGEGDVIDAADATARVAAAMTALRAYYESHAMAENVVEGAVNCADAIAGADPNTNTGWTGGIGIGDRDWEKYTDASGNLGGKYYDGGWSTTAGVNINMSRSIEIPAGRYLLTVTARGSENLTSYTLSIGEDDVDLPKNGSGVDKGVFGHGWDDVSLEFESDGHPVTLTIAATSTEYQQWISFNRLRLVQLELNTDAYANVSSDYTALNTAIEAADAKTLGFETDEYAPYVNAVALKALAEAKAMDQTAENTNLKTTVSTLAATLNDDANWTANTEEVNALNTALFTTGDVTGTGWTSTQTWGQVKEGVFSTGNGTFTYGEVAGYTMPLKENTVYKLTFNHRAWDGSNSENGGTVSVLFNEDGLDASEFAGQGTSTSSKAETFFFKTGAAGNYVFTLSATSGRPTFGGVTIMKAIAEAVTVSEEATEAPAHNYANVTLTRTLSASYWNTFSVPFDMAIPDGWTVKEFDSATDNVINFKNAESIVAGKPYLVKPTTDAENPVFNNVIVKSTEGSTDGAGDYKFAAQIYNKSLATDGTIAYLATDGKIKKLNTASGLKGLRAYFIIPAGAAARINFIDDETTGISRIENSELRIENSVYNLQGQRVNKAQKGLYIKNGKKVIVK